MMKFMAIIPARYASTRFPAKPLAMLDGKIIIQRVYERVAKVFPRLCVATDDERIKSAVEAFGGVAVMTSTAHHSGTDRCHTCRTGPCCSRSRRNERPAECRSARRRCRCG